MTSRQYKLFKWVTTGFLENTAQKSPVMIILLGVSLLSIVSLLDHFTGYEISFSIFYLLPIIYVSWHLGRFSGIVFCISAAGLWWFVDINPSHTYSSSLVPVWNAIVRLLFFLAISSLVVELKNRLEAEKKAANTDGLTGLLNARAFKNSSEQLLELALRYNHSVSLGYIDVDNFKWVNDHMGHSEGDRVLSEVAQSISQSVRKTDLVSRLGGDEFAVLLPETNSEGTRTIFDRMHYNLRELAKNNNWPISFSVGVAMFPNAPDDIDNAINIADDLMYRVKNSGKNQMIYEEQKVNASSLEK